MSASIEPVPSQKEFLSAILARNLGLNQIQAQKAAEFAHILHRENQIQNLTRITGVEAFVDGHLLDAIELLKQPTLGMHVVDVGSGCGVPGLLAAAIDLNAEREWFLCDSETNKAEYLQRAADELKLDRVSTSSQRINEIICIIEPDTVIARAVGTVEKIAGWISNCSTWNNLVLFKSKGWEEEWSESQKNRFGKKLTVSHTHEYASGDKYRLLVSLKRK